MNNRQLKFRVWDKAREQWLEHSENSLHAFTDYFLTFDGKIVATEGEICDHPNMEYQTNFDWYDYSERPFKITRGSERFVIQQYTGLKDKNKREIYEGDIIKYPNDTPSLNSGFYTSVVEYEELNCRFGIGFKIGGDYAEQDNVEVISNIFENPELLK